MQIVRLPLQQGRGGGPGKPHGRGRCHSDKRFEFKTVLDLARVDRTIKAEDKKRGILEMSGSTMTISYTEMATRRSRIAEENGAPKWSADAAQKRQ